MPLFVTDLDILRRSRDLSLQERESQSLVRQEQDQHAIVYFLHIPKCGGTSAAHLWRSVYPGCVATTRLNAASDIKHCRIHEIDDVFDLSFATVRHPLTWYESWWRYLLSPKVADREETLDTNGRPNFDTWIGEGVWHPLRAIAQCHDRSFQVFIDNVVATQPGFVSRMYEQYLGPNNGRLSVNRILKMENLHLEFSEFCRDYHFRPPPQEKHENKSLKSLETNWSSSQKQKVLDLERDAIVRFAYDKD